MQRACRVPGRRWWVRLAMGTALTAVGCGGQVVAFESTGSTGGTSERSAGTGGLDPGVPAGGEATSAAMSVPSAGGSVSGVSSPAAAGGFGASADAPPPECYTACLWELISECRPVGDCIEDRRADSIVSCEPGSAWRREFDRTSLIYTVHGPDGTLCYTITTEGQSTVYRDPDGNEVVTLDFGGRIDGRYLSTCADGSPPVLSSHNASACEPWALPDCSPGSCPF